MTGNSFIKSRYRISIDTKEQVDKFLKAIEGKENNVRLVGDNDEDKCVVYGKEFLKSVLGTLYVMSFKNLWLESDISIYSYIKDFVINESK